MLDGKIFPQNFILRPGGGLEGHVRRETAQAAASGSTRDRVLALSNMDLGVVPLQLLMEAALAGLQDMAKSMNCQSTVGSSEYKKPGMEASLDTPEHFSKSRENAAESLKRLAASKTVLDGDWSLDGQAMVHSVEINQNPRIGNGKDRSMKLIVQIAHLTAGQYLLRLHLDKNNIEDEGLRILTHTLKCGFAPRLEILWLSENNITDVGGKVFGSALETSLECLTELYLFRLY